MDTYEQFTWKSDGKIFKGIGMYHLTFSIPGKIHLFGEVKGATKEEIAQKVATIPGVHDITNELYVKGVKDLVRVDKTPFGKGVELDIANFVSRHPGVKVCKYNVMDTYLYAWLLVYQIRSALLHLIYFLLQHLHSSIRLFGGICFCAFNIF